MKEEKTAREDNRGKQICRKVERMKKKKGREERKINVKEGRLEKERIVREDIRGK